MLVIFFHAYARWPQHVPWATAHSEFPLFKYGWMGVELFFMISGFVIYMTLERCNGLWEFLYKRWLRLFPAMLIATVLVFFSSDLFRERPAGTPQWYDAIPGLLFLEPGILSKIFGVDFSSLEGAFWSLYVEVKFYLIFGTIYFINKKKSLHVLILIFLVVCIFYLGKYLGFLTDSNFLIKILFNLLSLNYFGWFCIGALIYLFKKNGAAKYLIGACVLLPLALELNTGRDPGALIFGMGVFLIFVGANSSKALAKLLSRFPFVFFGFLSYPLYLIHENLIIAMTVKSRLWAKWLPDMLTPVPGMLIVTIVAYIIASYLEPSVRMRLSTFKPFGSFRNGRVD
ncbi:peptidoglycan/LPS O-acetylase OafA/YrhL [Pseudacidovorax intermedius]|uniref:Peptidoglycan/LPS O-acetylase OafA/YrhL n=1 Tax=Pseudacidovorax intermedius TaxID=433924 RepID=A0A370FH27_9BURK|nr:peptidoglycan/LPS O-acetylase OafA/YrhL [Pseudacidovorax intermedius]